MRNCWLIRLAAAICVVALAAIAISPAAVQADEGDFPVHPDPTELDPTELDPSEIEEILQATPTFPALEGPADATFQFEVEFTYRSGDPQGRSFDLSVTGPPDWLTYIAESAHDLEQQISAIHLEPYTVGQPIVVVAVAPFWLYPEPGEYPIELRISGNDLEDVATLTATITPRYELDAETATGLDTTRTSVGSEATLGVNVINTGTAPIENVTLSADLPPDVNGQEWDVSFEPAQVTNLSPGSETEVHVAITPPGDAEPGDYLTTLKFDGEPALSDAPPSVPIRVSVAGQTSWGLVAVVVIALLAGGALLGYRKYGRKRA